MPFILLKAFFTASGQVLILKKAYFTAPRAISYFKKAFFTSLRANSYFGKANFTALRHQERFSPLKKIDDIGAPPTSFHQAFRVKNSSSSIIGIISYKFGGSAADSLKALSDGAGPSRFGPEEVCLDSPRGTDRFCAGKHI